MILNCHKTTFFFDKLNCHKTTVQQDQQNLLNRDKMLQREAKRQKQDADKSKQLARKVEQLKEKVLDCKQQFKSQNNMQILNSWKNRAKLNYGSSSEFRVLGRFSACMV